MARKSLTKDQKAEAIRQLKAGGAVSTVADAVGAAPEALGGHVGLEAQLGDDLVDDALLGLGDRRMPVDDPRDRADGHAGLPGNVADCRARFHIDLGVRFRRLCITVPQVISMRLLPGALDASGGSFSNGRVSLPCVGRADG